MRYSAFVLFLGVLTLAGCSDKETAEMPVNGVYPHLLKSEKEFVKELDKFSHKNDVESEKEKVRIKEKIFDMIAEDTTTLSHAFGSLDNDEFDIVTSPDKNLRIYVTTNDTNLMSMNLIQYRDDAGVIHVINAEQWKKQIGNVTDDDLNVLFKQWIHNIYDFSCKDGSRLYVIISDENVNREIMNHRISYTLAAYKMKNERLEPVEAFVSEGKTAQKMVREFNDSYFWSYPDEQHHSFAEVDGVNHVLYVGNEVNNEPVDRYQCFQFNGTNLTDIGESAPFWLHQSLHKYKRLKYLCVSKSHHIRIDDMGNGLYRYASWPRTQKYADEPAMVVLGKETSIPEKDGSVSHALSFTNDGYEYRILLYPGRWGLYALEMEILKNGKVIQKDDLE